MATATEPVTSTSVADPSQKHNHLELMRLPCRDLMRGVEWMMQPERAHLYLPRNPAEKLVDIGDGTKVDPWDVRRREARIYNKFRDAVVDAAGKMFAKPITPLKDTPPDLVEFLDDVDGMGTSVQVFGLSVVLRAVAEGSHFVLADYPPSKAGAQPRTEAEERADTGLRCVWKPYSSANVLGWSIGTRRGQPYLQHVRLLEDHEIPGDSPWDSKCEPQVRVLYAGDPDNPDTGLDSRRWARYELWRETGEVDRQSKKVWRLVESGPIRPQVDVPLVEFATDPMSPFESIPPYLDIKSLVLAHFRKTSLLDAAHRAVGFPFLHWAGGSFDKDGNPVGISADRMVISTNPSSKFEFVEPAGTSWGSVEANLRALEDQIEQLADTIALSDQPGSITATGEAIRSARAVAKLDSWALSFQDAFSELLRLTAIYSGVVTADQETGWGGLEINRVFVPSLQSAQNFEQRKFLYQIKAITARRLFEAAQDEGAIPEDADFDEESREREAEGPDPMELEAALARAESKLAAGRPDDDEDEEPNAESPE